MAHDWPDVPNLVGTAREFIEGVTGKLDGQDRYYALCASYLLEIVERELADWAPCETADDARLRKLLDGAQNLPRDELAATLSAEIRAGRLDDRGDELLEALLSHVRSKVEVSKPSFLAGSDADAAGVET